MVHFGSFTQNPQLFIDNLKINAIYLKIPDPRSAGSSGIPEAPSATRY